MLPYWRPVSVPVPPEAVPVRPPGRRGPSAGRAKAPSTAAEISGYLALADAQPAEARRARAADLVCLGAGAGLIPADLRHVRGTDVRARSRGVIVQVRGARPRGGARAGPLPRPAAGIGGLRWRWPGHRRR